MTEGIGAGTPDLRGLEDKYEFLGELRGTDAGRTYIARTRGAAAEVAIMVVRAPRGAMNNELSHFAADAQILETRSHPTLARVIGGHWVRNDSFAIITERLNGDTLGELLDRGERFSNPRIALMLQEVSGLLDWARNKGIVHRTVTPDTLVFERDSNRLRASFTPAEIPITGVAGACGDARTLGMLAWAMFTGERYTDADSARSLGDVTPGLAARVIDATDHAIHCKDEAPDIATFLGIIGSGDVLKQAEVELAAQKEEYDEAHRQELYKCELQRQDIERRAAEQIEQLARDREDFKRDMADERATMAADRAEFENVMAERKERLAAVRATLDAQRAEMEQRLAALEVYRAEVEDARDNALAAANKARQDAIADAERWRAEVLAAGTAAGMNPSAAAAAVKGVPLPKHAAIPRVPIPAAPKALKEMKAPKWDKAMEKLDVSDEELIAAGGRPRWLIPAGVLTLAIIVVAVGYGATHKTVTPPDSVRVGNSTVIPTAPAAQTPIVPRAGFLAPDSVAVATTAGGAAAGRGALTSAVISATGAASRVDSAGGAVSSPPGAVQPRPAPPPATGSVPPSSATAPTATTTRPGAPATAPRRRPTQEEIDSVNTSPEEWARMKRADSIAHARARRDSIRRDSLRRDGARRDTTELLLD